MEQATNTTMTRRQLVRTLAAASVGAMLPASMSATSEAARGIYDFEPVRQRILEAVANGKATGVAVAIAKAGRIIWEEGFGWANRDTELKVTAHTPFSLASITKLFTSTTVMTLVPKGKLSLDDPRTNILEKAKLWGRTEVLMAQHYEGWAHM